MIKIDNECLIMENGVVIPLKSIHLVKPFGDDLYFVNTKNGHCAQYPYKVEELYQVLLSAGKSNFILVENVILNCYDIEAQYIQTAKDCKTEKMGFALHIVFNNGRNEEIFFDTHNEAENYYHIIDDKIIDIKNAEAIKNLINS